MHRPRSLRARLALLAVVAVGIAIALSSTLIYRNLDRALKHAVDDTLRVRVSEVESEVRAREVDLTDNRAYAQVFSSRGGVVASTFAAAGRTLADPEVIQAARNGDVETRAVIQTTDGRRGRVQSIIRYVPKTQQFVLAGVDVENESLARRRIGLSLLVAGPLLLGLAGTAAWAVAGAALRPAARMAEEAEAISLSEPGRRLPEPEDEELGHLARRLNTMLARMEVAYAQEQEFVDNSSHELRTPIAILRGELELALADHADPGALEASLRSALEEIDRLSALTEQLLLLARARVHRPDTHLEPLPIGECVRECVERLPTVPGLTVEVDDAPGATVLADRIRIEQILTNLLTNAGRHAHTRIRVQVSSMNGETDINVADDGDGFPPEFIPRALDRFTRADSVRNRNDGGSGLGLAIVAALARLQGGSVTIANGPPLGGASVTVRLRSA